ncbi:hypothetical protein Dimus_028733 [Dionaea muscipula]
MEQSVVVPFSSSRFSLDLSRPPAATSMAAIRRQLATSTSRLSPSSISRDRDSWVPVPAGLKLFKWRRRSYFSNDAAQDYFHKQLESCIFIEFYLK